MSFLNINSYCPLEFLIRSVIQASTSLFSQRELRPSLIGAGNAFSEINL